MPVRLVALDEGPDILLDRAMVVVGRHPSCDTRLDSLRVSRQHCCMSQEKGEVTVRDWEHERHQDQWAEGRARAVTSWRRAIDRTHPFSAGKRPWSRADDCRVGRASRVLGACGSQDDA